MILFNAIVLGIGAALVAYGRLRRTGGESILTMFPASMWDLQCLS
jgi:hypothetical protein